MISIDVDYIDERSSVEYPEKLFLSPDITLERLCALSADIERIFALDTTNLDRFDFDLEIYTTPIGCEFDYDESYVSVKKYNNKILLTQCFMRQVHFEDRLISYDFSLSELIDFIQGKKSTACA